MSKLVLASFSTLLCLSSNVLIQPASAMTWYDYGFLKACGEIVSMEKHGHPGYRDLYRKSTICKQRLADSKANN